MTIMLIGQQSMLPHLVTYNNCMPAFQHKISSNALFLKKNLHTFGIKPSSPLCFFCDLYDETHFHIFYKCDRVKLFWSVLVQCFQISLILPTVTPQSAIFGILDSASNDSIFKNKVFIRQILLIFVNISNLISEK